MTGSSVSDLLLFHRSNCSHIFWTVTPLFQKVICSDLSFILLKDLVVLSNNHLQSSLLSWYWFDFTTLVAAIRTWITLFLLQKSSRSHKIFKIYCFFFFRKAVAVKRYHNYQVWYLLVLGMYLLIVCFWRHQLQSFIFFCGTVIISREHLKRSVISSRTCLLWEKFKGT